MKTDYIDRVSGRFILDTTRKEILERWSLFQQPPNLVPRSAWTRAEIEAYLVEFDDEAGEKRR